MIKLRPAAIVPKHSNEAKTTNTPFWAKMQKPGADWAIGEEKQPNWEIAHKLNRASDAYCIPTCSFKMILYAAEAMLWLASFTVFLVAY